MATLLENSRVVVCAVKFMVPVRKKCDITITPGSKFKPHNFVANSILIHMFCSSDNLFDLYIFFSHLANMIIQDEQYKA